MTKFPTYGPGMRKAHHVWQIINSPIILPKQSTPNLLDLLQINQVLLNKTKDNLIFTIELLSSQALLLSPVTGRWSHDLWWVLLGKS